MVKHQRGSPYPPLMKSTKVYSDSTLKDSSVTLKTETCGQKRQTRSNQSEAYRRLFSVLWLMSVEQRQQSRQDSPFPSWCISSSCLSFSDSKPWQQNTVKRKWVLPANAAELWTHTGGRLLIMHRPQIRAGIRNSGGNCFNELCTDVGEVTRKTLFFNNHADKQSSII